MTAIPTHMRRRTRTPEPDPLQYVRTAYHVPARLGGRVQFIAADTSVRYGTIVGGTHYVRVRWDDGTEANLHPTYHVIYLDEHGYPIARTP